MSCTTAELRRVLEILADYPSAPLNQAAIDLALRLARVTTPRAA